MVKPVLVQAQIKSDGLSVFFNCEDKTYIFALNMDMSENTPYALRVDMAKKGLEKLGLLKSKHNIM